MKFLIFALINWSAFSAFAAPHDYTGRYAKYVITTRTGSGAETKIGESEIRVLSFNSTTLKYTVQLTNQKTGAKPEISTSLTEETEFLAQDQGAIFNRCVDNYGELATPFTLNGQTFTACRILSSNTAIDVGLVPFSVLRSVSQAGGSAQTTTLVEFKP